MKFPLICTDNEQHSYNSKTKSSIYNLPVIKDYKLHNVIKYPPQSDLKPTLQIQLAKRRIKFCNQILHNLK